MHVCVFASGLLSGPGLFRGAEQSRRNERLPDLKHLQACTFDFFLVLSLSSPPFPHTLMAACLKAAAGSYRGASSLHSRLHFLSLLVHLVAMDTIDRPRFLFLSFFFFVFCISLSLLNLEDFGFGGHIIFSYCNLLYVVLFLFLTRNSRRTSVLMAVFVTAVHQTTFELVPW